MQLLLRFHRLSFFVSNSLQGYFLVSEFHTSCHIAVPTLNSWCVFTCFILHVPWLLQNDPEIGMITKKNIFILARFCPLNEWTFEIVEDWYKQVIIDDLVVNPSKNIQKLNENANISTFCWFTDWYKIGNKTFNYWIWFCMTWWLISGYLNYSSNCFGQYLG